MPRVVRGICGLHMNCGCLAGMYETYGGGIVTIIDARGDRCGVAGHRPGAEVLAPGDTPLPGEPGNAQPGRDRRERTRLH